jgi:hypothetical protein
MMKWEGYVACMEKKERRIKYRTAKPHRRRMPRRKMSRWVAIKVGPGPR